jgi:tetrahydrodipicolinate N-succinyltransferase
VVEGCIVREGSVLGMGVFIGKSTKIVDRITGEISYGEVPPYSVVVSGSMPGKLHDGQWRGRAEPLLRRDRQAGRRADPLEDRHQRIVARLIDRP